MPDEWPDEWTEQIERAYTVFGLHPSGADELGLFGRVGGRLDIDFLRRKAQDQLRDALGRWKEERGTLPVDAGKRADIPDVDAWDTRNVRRKFKEQFAEPNARLKGKHRLKVPDDWNGQLTPGDTVEVEYDEDGFLRDIKLPESNRFVSRTELDDLEIDNGIRDEETFFQDEKKHGFSEWFDAWTPPDDPRRRNKDR